MSIYSKKPFRYAVVGIANTFFYAGLLFVFIKYVDVPNPVSVGLAFIIAMIFQYLANRIYTFRSSNTVGKELFRYLTVAVSNYFITLIVVYFSLSHFLMTELVASLLASFVTAINGYILSLLWVFNYEK